MMAYLHLGKLEVRWVAWTANYQEGHLFTIGLLRLSWGKFTRGWAIQWEGDWPPTIVRDVDPFYRSAERLRLTKYVNQETRTWVLQGPLQRIS